MSKDPLADSLQSDTLYSVPPFIGVKVRSLTEAACKDAKRNGSKSRHLNFIPTASGIAALQSTRNYRLRSHLCSLLIYRERIYSFSNIIYTDQRIGERA